MIRRSKSTRKISQLPVNGFTLVELLVATTILMLLVVMLGTMAGHVSRMWTEVHGQNQRRVIGRDLLQFIVRDLQAAMLAPPSGPSITTNKSGNLQLVVVCGNDTIGDGDATAIANPQAIFWQAPIAMNRQLGNTAEVGYFVQWDTSAPGKAKPYLCRYYSDATKPSFGVYTAGTNPVPWLGGSASPTNVAPATPSAKYAGWLADNVIGLWIRCTMGGTTNTPIKSYLSQSNTLTPFANNGYSFDSYLGYADSSKLGRFGPALPPCIEISLVVVDSSTAQKITTPLTDYKASDPAVFSSGSAIQGSVQNYVSRLPDYIRSGVEVFSTKVFLQNSAN